MHEFGSGGEAAKLSLFEEFWRGGHPALGEAEAHGWGQWALGGYSKEAEAAGPEPAPEGESNLHVFHYQIMLLAHS